MRVVLCGVGGVGRNVTRLLRARPDCRIVEACSRNPDLIGRDLGELAGGSPLGVAVSGDLGMALSEPADLLLVATTSFLGGVAADVRAGLERGLNVITTAEEAAFTWIIDADLARELDELARDRGVSVIGLGLNPGFIFDALLLTASGIAWDVREIRIRRVVDVSRFSATIQRRLGIGFTAERFAEGVAAGSITGHIGFPQSFHLAARCMGVHIDRIESGFEPLVADRPHDGANLSVEPGTTAGFVQRYRAICDGRPWMSAEFIAHVDPPSAGHEPSDSIHIDGYNELNLAINPGCQPQLGTAAMIANVMPRLVEARPGYLTVADLALRTPGRRPVPSPEPLMKLAIVQMESVMGEVRRNIDSALRLLDQAAASGADVALLPEYWSTGFFPASRDYRRYDLAAADDGPAMSAIRDKAVELGMHVVASIFERDGSDLCYDTAMLVGPDGRIIGKYRKTHIAGERHIVVDGELVTDLGIESIYFRTGMRFPVFGIGEWRVGIMLCYDTYFPEAARCLALAGAEVILAPFGISDTKKTIWKELLAARAFENIVYLAAANNTGYVPAPDMPIVMGGHSIAIDPYGEELAMASYDRDEVLRVDLDRDHLLRARRMHFMFRDRRPEAYGCCVARPQPRLVAR